MPTRFTRLSVVAGQQQLDASLPSTRPVAEFLTDLPALFSLAPGSSPTAWALSTPRHGQIPPDRCLDEVGVLDGDVLYLSAAAEAAESPFVEDVLHAIEITVDTRAAPWRDMHRDRVITYLLAAVALITGLAILRVPATLGAGIGLIVAALGCVGLGHYLRDRGGLVVAWIAPPLAVLASLRLSEGYFLGTRVAVGVAAALAGIGLVAWTRRWRAIVVATAIDVVGAVLVGLTLSWGVDGASLAAWASPPLVLALGVLPQIALNASGLVGMVERGEVEGRVPRSELIARTSLAAARIDGAVMGTAGAGAAAVAAMVVSGRSGQPALGLLVAAIFALRSRGFAAATHVGWLLAVPVTGLVATAIALPVWSHTAAPEAAALQRIAGLLVAGGLVALLGYLRLNAPNAARLTRLLDFLDTVAIVALIPVVLLAQHVFGWLAARL